MLHLVLKTKTLWPVFTDRAWIKPGLGLSLIRAFL